MGCFNAPTNVAIRRNNHRNRKIGSEILDYLIFHSIHDPICTRLSVESISLSNEISGRIKNYLKYRVVVLTLLQLVRFSGNHGGGGYLVVFPANSLTRQELLEAAKLRLIYR